MTLLILSMSCWAKRNISQWVRTLNVSTNREILRYAQNDKRLVISNTMNQYRYQLEKYRGRGSRYVCPKCRHKHSFTRYIDTYNNNNIYINDDVGKCNRLDKCGYHYTPRQYFEDNPWLRDTNTPLYTWTDSHLHRQNVRLSTPHFSAKYRGIAPL